MGLPDWFQSPVIHAGLRKMRKVQGAVLLDVRTKEEYAAAHIPGGQNIPLDELQTVKSRITHPDTPLFVHCLSGGRRSRAVHFLKRAGYTDATDLGGIAGYRGIMEKGV